MDGRELIGGPDGENDKKDEGREIDSAASAKTGDAADVDHCDVGKPHGEGEDDLWIAEVGGANGDLRDE